MIEMYRQPPDLRELPPISGMMSTRESLFLIAGSSSWTRPTPNVAFGVALDERVKATTARAVVGTASRHGLRCAVGIRRAHSGDRDGDGGHQ